MILHRALLVTLGLVHLVTAVCLHTAMADDSPAASAVPPAPAHVAASERAVVLGDRATPAEKRAAELLAERLQDRSGVTLADGAEKTKYRLTIGTAATSDAVKTFLAADHAGAGLGADGSRIVVDPAKPEWIIAGESPIAVVAGVGRLLRELRYADAAVEVPALDVTERPRMPNRGMYLWPATTTSPSRIKWIGTSRNLRSGAATRLPSGSNWECFSRSMIQRPSGGSRCIGGSTARPAGWG